jgi:hypothetical protein
MRRNALFALALAWLAACDSPTAVPSRLDPSAPGPSFALVANEWEPFVTVQPNPCPPAELVLITGEVHSVLTAGPGRRKLHQNTRNVHGMGLVTGSRYTQANNGKIKTVLVPGGESESHHHLRLIRQGSQDNLYITFIFRTSDEVRFEIIRDDRDCRG